MYYKQELEHFHHVTRFENNEDLALKTIGHALLWGSSLLECYEETEGNFIEWSKEDESFEIVEGFRFARHRVIHQFIQAVHITDGVAFPLEFPTPFFEIQWVNRSQLPSNNKRHEHKRIGDCYEKALQGIPVRFTLDALNGFFKRASEI